MTRISDLCYDDPWAGQPKPSTPLPDPGSACCPQPARCDCCGGGGPLTLTTICPEPELGLDATYGGLPCLWTCPRCLTGECRVVDERRRNAIRAADKTSGDPDSEAWLGRYCEVMEELELAAGCTDCGAQFRGDVKPEGAAPREVGFTCGPCTRAKPLNKETKTRLRALLRPEEHSDVVLSPRGGAA